MTMKPQGLSWGFSFPGSGDRWRLVLLQDVDQLLFGQSGIGINSFTGQLTLGQRNARLPDRS
jgi:hypothetical protein